jgi:hypothetical protein
MRPVTEALCAEMFTTERACFDVWCKLFDRGGKPEPAEVIASQEPVRLVAAKLREVCLAAPDAAEAERRELMRRQVEGEIGAEAEKRMHRSATASGKIRQEWNNARWRIFSARDALTIGLGWPYRGEQVTVTKVRSGEHIYTGPGIYDGPYDTHNTSCLVWVPDLHYTCEEKRCGRSRAHTTLTLCWEPSERWGNADPFGDIAMRLACLPGQRMPVPLLRWPTEADLTEPTDPLLHYAENEQMGLFG